MAGNRCPVALPHSIIFMKAAKNIGALLAGLANLLYYRVLVCVCCEMFA